MSSLIFFGAIILIFYFFMIRPQMKKQKELKQYRSALAKGDKVITSGGIYGKISEIKDTTVLVEISPDIRVKVDKGSIVRNAQDAAETQQQNKK
ncbi:MAG: preprotein translocase subunit YajC [Bacteroidetes bacterium]|nr:preprotein translocase subunit YajC [Bacteroidota bacterium]MBT3751191.1 preprotein translocase subunit YajC [Bacteroidota bacterium]MBT4398544.1 preprotein translocase subunit YajC [Bacteroidota bacterium]MBT4411930.1 preprotein translocase subunit YajC [Bacteroidota bacterium]MBT7463591.1 preprotein translocase subunit YajC [Bacteroidota bacterium]